MKDKNHRCVECLSKIWRTATESWQGQFREMHNHSQGWWGHWFSLTGWLISAVTGSLGLLFQKPYREKEHCGNNTHFEPVKSQMCLNKWILSHRKEGFPQWLTSPINEERLLKYKICRQNELKADTVKITISNVLFVFMLNKQFRTFWSLYTFALLARVRWEDEYFSHVCTVNISLAWL